VRDDRWHELTDAECRKLLAERHLGRLALTDPDGPVIFPVNYALDEDGWCSAPIREPSSTLSRAAQGRV
jgi:nitroimidazol reductase NimA-like FMN-containing flavoprotein (pyridoxamine 5'-phosphate oxidase superfamily)